MRWRLGMAQFGGWVDALSQVERDGVIAAAEAAMGPNPQPLRREVLILSSIVPA